MGRYRAAVCRPDPVDCLDCLDLGLGKLVLGPRSFTFAHFCCPRPPSPGAATGAGAESRPPLRWRPKATTFVLSLNKARVPALNAAHVLRLNKAEVLALNKAHDLRLSTKMCPVFSQHKGGGLRPPPQMGTAFGRPPFVVSFVLALNKGHFLALNTTHRYGSQQSVLTLDKAHILRLNTRICPVVKATTKETALGRLMRRWREERMRRQRGRRG